jgi:hypothetical protein
MTDSTYDAWKLASPYDSPWDKYHESFMEWLEDNHDGSLPDGWQRGREMENLLHNYIESVTENV